MPPCTQNTKFIIPYKPPHRKRKLRTEEKTMLSIPLKTVDKLQEICLELEILTYFSTLMQTDDDTLPESCGTLQLAKRNAPGYLHNRQFELIAALSSLLHSEPFLSTEPEEN